VVQVKLKLMPSDCSINHADEAFYGERWLSIASATVQIERARHQLARLALVDVDMKLIL
jgi:hypothetical protein